MPRDSGKTTYPGFGLYRAHRGLKDQSWVNVGPACTSSLRKLIIVVYRVNWLRARSRRDRWEEELDITAHEMVWVTRYFTHRADAWRNVATSDDLGAVGGPYAFRQAGQWDRMAGVAHDVFSDVNPDLRLVFGYSSPQASLWNT